MLPGGPPLSQTFGELWSYSLFDFRWTLFESREETRMYSHAAAMIGHQNYTDTFNNWGGLLVSNVPSARAPACVPPGSPRRVFPTLRAASANGMAACVNWSVACENRSITCVNRSIASANRSVARANRSVACSNRSVVQLVGLSVFGACSLFPRNLS